MKRAMIRAIALLLLAARVCALAEVPEDLEEVRCSEWNFSVRIPSGMEVLPYDYEDEEYGKTTGGGLIISADKTDGMLQVCILRRDHAFNNPTLYLTNFCWESLSDNTDEDFEDDIWGLFRYGGIVLRGAGVRFLGDEGEVLFRECRFIPYRDDRGTEFVLRFTPENEQKAYSLLDTVIRNYLPDEEPEKAAARYRPVLQQTDPENGTFRVSFEDVDRIGEEGYFTAVLYTTDLYSAEDVLSMKPGDTLQINGRVFTLSDVDNEDPVFEVSIGTIEDARDQSLWGFIFEKSVSGDGYYLYIMDDWYSVSRVASVRIDASVPIAYYEVPGGDDPELMDENLLDDESGIRTLTQLMPYSTTCSFDGGKLIRIDSASYPVGPMDSFIPMDQE